MGNHSSENARRSERRKDILNRFENFVFAVQHDVAFWHSPKEKLRFSHFRIFSKS
jgi:hypothetical protein